MLLALWPSTHRACDQVLQPVSVSFIVQSDLRVLQGSEKYRQLEQFLHCDVSLVEVPGYSNVFV